MGRRRIQNGRSYQNEQQGGVQKMPHEMRAERERRADAGIKSPCGKRDKEYRRRDEEYACPRGLPQVQRRGDNEDKQHGRYIKRAAPQHASGNGRLGIKGHGEIRQERYRLEPRRPAEKSRQHDPQIQQHEQHDRQHVGPLRPAGRDGMEQKAAEADERHRQDQGDD
jgi:hypothetical protein